MYGWMDGWVDEWMDGWTRCLSRTQSVPSRSNYLWQSFRYNRCRCIDLSGILTAGVGSLREDGEEEKVGRKKCSRIGKMDCRKHRGLGIGNDGWVMNVRTCGQMYWMDGWMDECMHAWMYRRSVFKMEEME